MQSILALRKLIKEEMEKSEDPDFRRAEIRLREEKYFPPIVQNEIINLLTIKNQEQIPWLLNTLYHIREKGPNAVWELIEVEVTLIAKRKCGTIFPQESIDKGKNLPLDMEYLALHAANQIIPLESKRYDLKQEVMMAYNITDKKHDDTLLAYLEKNTPKPYSQLSVKDRKANSLQKHGPSSSDRLETLGKQAGEISDTSFQLLETLAMTTSSASSHQFNKKACFFAHNPGKQGCEPPPGSVYDDRNNVIVPPPSP